ncbi:DUF4175 family protein [Commensalibacter papalotli (ex Servin-Garciduenas et al. 2014)]|uniref:TIGR02302 family protein n=1 Tax=Commensalibacter papalotli (ex Servin-Garciduenas et al. 2014) TaxID=1208583 RepID=W7DV87_9PROT|nr:DUF4175 family protein [Commensalibacter papalotli (ex Servin-Garciduenas et al. 2014)]EUK18940.1 hypothetical protein COMX_04300 [Commensalibacter papalotli (ex Servin-Garciduenas et al. 2014)]
MNIPQEHKAQIKKAIFLTKLNVWIEKYWPIFLLFLSLWGIYLCLGLLGIPQRLPDILRILILAIMCIGSIGLVIYQIKRFPFTSFKENLNRIEQINKLPNQPLQTLYDTPVQTENRAVWNIHIQRIFKNFPDLKVGAPKIFKGHYHINRIAIVTICIFAALFVSNKHIASSRLLSAMRPGYDDASMPLPNFQAWVIPPSYSNAAPIYIKSRTETIATDPKARLHIALTDLKQRPELIYSEKKNVISNISIQQPEANQWQIEATIENPGTINIQARGREVASWNINLPDNLPPKVTWTGPIEKSNYDWKTAFPFEASQHYGIQSFRLVVTVPQNKEHPKEKILSLTQPLGDHPKKITQILHQDLSNNIWAGSQAQAIISATDVTGQNTTSKVVTFTLPRRTFSSPVAQKLDQIRQAYGTDKLSKENTLNELIQLQNIPNAFQDYDLFLNYISIIYFLDNANKNTPQVKTETLSRLWDLMIDTQERKSSNSEIAKANIELRAAQASVQEQLDKMQRLGKDKITNQDRQELNKRLERLQNAVAQKMMALAKQNAKDNPQDGNSKELQYTSTRSFEDMFKDMSKTMENGNMDKAMQQLEYTNQVLNTMRGATPKDIKKLEDHLKSQKEMEKLTKDIEKLIKEQQDLLNQTYARLNQSVPLLLRPSQDLNKLSTSDLIKQITPHKDEEKSEPALASVEQTAQSQQGLIESLTKLQTQMHAITKQPIQNLDLAKINMQDAQQALENKDDSKAAAAQQKALINLQKGKDSAKKTMQQEAQRFSNFFPVFTAKNPQEDPSADNKADVDKKKDPLGRSPNENNSQIELSGNASTARKIEEELRKRADDPNRSGKDLDYIYRLLNMF